MFPLDELGQLHQLAKLDGMEEWYSYRTATPSHQFTTVLRWFPTTEVCCVFTVRDHYPLEWLTALVTFTDAHVDLLSIQKRLTKLSSLPGGINFTSVVYVNHDCHDTFRHEIPSLLPKTLVAFPTFDCEFSGDETPDQIRCMRRDFITTIDWNRRPVPKILMRHSNLKTKSKSLGPKLRLASVETLMNELQCLNVAPGSFIEIENYKHQQCRIASNGDRNHISFGDLELSSSDTVNFANNFVHKGMN